MEPVNFWYEGSNVTKRLLTQFTNKYNKFLLLSGIYNPYQFEPPPSEGSEITHKDAPQSVGLLWTSDQPVAETST